MKTKSTSQTASKRSWKNPILLAITALALYTSPSSRGIELCNQQLFSSWTNAGSANWSDASNWCGGVPLCHSFTCISNGGTAQISTGTTAQACETFLGQYQCDPVLCQNSRGSSGNLSVAGGTLNTCNELHVGYQGMGNLKITNGGVVSSFGADIATGAGSFGAATVDGTNSTWTVTGSIGLYVGGTNGSSGGTGLLAVTNGATVKADQGSVYVYKSGTLTGNATVDATYGTSLEGTLAPDWTLTISGDLTFVPNTTATMQCKVTPQNSGNDAEVTGTARLDDKLSVTMTGDFTSGPNRFALLHADVALQGTFHSVSITYPTDQGFTPKIDYVGNYVYLDLVFNQN